MNPELKSSLDSISTAIGGFGSKFATLQTQVDAIDMRTQKHFSGGDVPPSLIEKLKGEDSIARLLKDGRGSAVIHFDSKEITPFTKTTITSAGQGYMTTGVMAIDRVPGIVPEARQELTVRDALTSNPTTLPIVDFVRVLQPLTVGSPAPEASTKVENQLSFISLSERVRTIATWLPASKQVISDLPELANFINSSLPYYINLGEEQQLLSGDGTGENLHGLIPQSAAFQSSLLPGGGTRIDYIGACIEQIQTSKELSPSFVILHPTDWWRMRLQKDSLGRYILGDPQSSVAARLFDLLVIPTTSMSVGVFLVGSGNSAASEIRDRQELVVEVSTEHANFFTQNLIAIRAEKRLCLLVKRPNSYVTGSFSGASPQ
jgi:HK97 family phage major capsid protein